MPRRSIAFTVLLAVCAGCNARSGEPKPPAEAAPAPAKSTISLFRGSVTPDGDGWRFRPCEGGETRVADSTGGVLARVARGEAGAASPGAYAELRGHLAADSSLVVTHVEGAFPGEGGGCGRPAPAVEALARGNEPFWSITVDRARERIVWRTPADSFETPYAAPRIEADRRDYAARTEAHSIDLKLEDTGCTDNMSGAYSAWKAAATVDGAAYSGCARVER
jgi:putative lipoprotein